MSGLGRFREKPNRPTVQARKPGFTGDCPDCGTPMREDRYHDCGDQLELVFPEPSSRRKRR